MQSRLDSPSFNSTSHPNQRFMEWAREAAIRARREEQEAFVQSRKRKLSELFQVTRLVHSNKPVSGTSHHAPGAANENGIDESEKKFLELNDIIQGRFYDDATLSKIIATITQSLQQKHVQITSPVLSRKTTAPQQSPRQSAATGPVVSSPQPIAVSPILDVKQTEQPFVDSSRQGAENITALDAGVEHGVAASADGTPQPRSPTLNRNGSPLSPKRRKIASKPSSPTLPKQDVQLPSPISGEMAPPLSNLTHLSDRRAPIVEIGGIPVIQSAATPVTSAALKDPLGDGIAVGPEASIHPPPPPPRPSEAPLDRKVRHISGGPAAIEKDVHDSIAKISHPEHNVATPPTHQDHGFQFVPMQKRSPSASQPQLAVVPPVHQSIQRASPPTPAPSLPDRQNTPSSPITSDEDDDDRENNVAIISSATSPDASGHLPDDTSLEMRQEEELEKKESMSRMGDPSAQLRFEDELARKDQLSEDKAVKPGELLSKVTGGPLDKRDVTAVTNGKLSAEEVSVNGVEGEEVIVEAQKKAGFVADTGRHEPVADTDETIQSGKHTELQPGEQVDKENAEEAAKVAKAPSSRPLEGIPTEVLESTSTRSPPTLADASKSGSDIVSEVRPSKDDKGLEKSKASERPDQPLSSAVVIAAKAETATRQSIIPQEKAEVTESVSEPEEPIKKLEKRAGISLSAQREATAAHDLRNSEDLMEIDGAESVTAIGGPAESSVDKNDDIAAKERFQSQEGPISAPSEEALGEISVAGSKNMGEVPTDASISVEPPLHSLALIKHFEQQRKREQELARLKKVVFTGGSPKDKLKSDGKGRSVPARSDRLRQQQEIVNFLTYSSQKPALSESTALVIQPPQQLTRQRSSSITLAHNSSYAKKDYLTPYFQLEAFEQPLQDLLSKSHNHKILLTANHQVIHQEQQTKKIFRRITQLQDKGLWSLRQPARQPEPARKLCHWDYLLQEAHWISVDFREERRFKIAQCKMMVDMVMEWHGADPEERKYLCVDRAEYARKLRSTRRKRASHEISGDEEGVPAEWRQLESHKSDDGEYEVMENVTVIPKPEQSTPQIQSAVGATEKPDHLPGPNQITRDLDGCESHIDLEGEDSDIFGHIANPPAQLFTLGPEETIFQMPLTGSANEILSELPLYTPPTLPVDPSVLDKQVEEIWQMPIVPVSKYCVSKLVFKEEGPPRKKSRYEFEENYNLFADDSDPEDGSTLPNKGHLNKTQKAQKAPTPLPPESTTVALFNPDYKPILNRMHAGHNLKPPGYLPPVAFFENRQASQWLPSEDEKLKDMAQKYPQNWSLISTFMTLKGDLQSSAERRSPWECFERYLQIEANPPDLAKNPYYKGIQQRLEIANKASAAAASSANGANGNTATGSGSSTPTVRRRGNVPVRVDRRKNTKFIALFESMRKLAKRRELTLSKQQNSASIANRKAEQQSQNKPKLQHFVPAHFSKMKYERELKIERQAREAAALAAQQRQHAQQRNATPGVNSPVVPSSNPNGVPGLPQGVTAMPVHRASPAVAHALPNGPIPNATGAPIPSMTGILHNGVPVPQVNGAAAANAMALGLRPPHPQMNRTAYSQEQLQLMRLKVAQQQQAAAAQAAQHAQNSNQVVGMGGLMNYSQHAIIAAQQQAINAAANGAGVKQQQHHVNGQQDSNSQNSMAQQQRTQINIAGQVQAGSPRLHQPHVAPHPPNAQAIAQWVQRTNPGLNAADVQKLTEQRLAEYHMQIRQQLTQAGIPQNVTAMTPQQQHIYQQQQALRHQQHLIQQQAQQQRQSSQGPVQIPPGSTIVGGVVSRGATPQMAHNQLQRSASMQGVGVGHALQRTQSIGQQQQQQQQAQQSQQSQMQQQQHHVVQGQQQSPRLQGAQQSPRLQGQQQSPRQAQVQQAQMAGMQQQPPQLPPQI